MINWKSDFLEWDKACTNFFNAVCEELGVKKMVVCLNNFLNRRGWFQ